MRDITHFLLATLLSLATLACRHDTPPADGSLSRQLPPDTKEILRQQIVFLNVLLTAWMYVMLL